LTFTCRQTDAFGRLVELAAQLHLALPIAANVEDGSCDRLKPMPMFLGHDGFLSWYALTVQPHVSLQQHLGAGFDDLDRAHVLGAERARYFSDRW
jgi:hypothetical protein